MDKFKYQLGEIVELNPDADKQHSRVRGRIIGRTEYIDTVAYIVSTYSRIDEGIRRHDVAEFEIIPVTKESET